MRLKAITGFFMIFLLCLMSLACVHSPARKAYNVIYTAAEVYDAALSYAGDQYKAGKISADHKDEIINLARKYQKAVKAAQAALFEYRKAQLAGEKEYINSAEAVLDIAMQSMQSARAVMAVSIQSSVKGGLK